LSLLDIHEIVRFHFHQVRSLLMIRRVLLLLLLLLLRILLFAADIVKAAMKCCEFFPTSSESGDIADRKLHGARC
jgi:hypothetical protein